MSWKYVQRNDESGQYRTTDEGGGGGGSSTFAGLDDVSFSGLQNGQVPKYNSSTGKWENDDESGGTVTDVQVDGTSVVDSQGVAQITIPTPPSAPVQDVQVDGVSVVDGQGVADITIPTPDYPVRDVKVNGISVVSNKEAQIKSYKEVTQAEYNALPASKLTDNIMYCIKDAPSSGQGFPPLIYSDEEREIGVWRDGKPIYEKTVNFGTLPNNNVKDVSHGISNIDKIWISGGFAYQPNGDFTNQLSLCVPSDLSSGWYFGVNSSIIRCVTGSNRTAYSAYVTVQYTKTTDTPGSGIWTTQGEYAHHYSTSEKVIGTWIDGKPLYEKTYVYDITQTLEAGNTDIINVGTDKNVIDMSIIMKNKVNGRTYKLAYAQPGNSGLSHNVVFMENGYLQIRIINDSWGTKYCMYATLQYTKTTD